MKKTIILAAFIVFSASLNFIKAAESDSSTIKGTHVFTVDATEYSAEYEILFPDGKDNKFLDKYPVIGELEGEFKGSFEAGVVAFMEFYSIGLDPEKIKKGFKLSIVEEDGLTTNVNIFGITTKGNSTQLKRIPK